LGKGKWEKKSTNKKKKDGLKSKGAAKNYWERKTWQGDRGGSSGALNYTQRPNVPNSNAYVGLKKRSGEREGPRLRKQNNGRGGKHKKKENSSAPDPTNCKNALTGST